jgi:hypothetical protein
LTITNSGLVKLGLILAAVSSVATAQSLNTFTCSPATIAPGATATCTATITSMAPITGVPIGIGKTGVGLTLPTSVSVPYFRTSVSFNVTSTASTPLQTATIIATAAGASRSATLTITTALAYTITSLSCTPAQDIPGQTGSCLGYLSAEAPAGGFVVGLSSSSPDLPVPPSVSIPAKQNFFQFNVTASSNVTVVEKVTITATLKTASSSTAVMINPAPKFYLKCNNAELSVLANATAVTPTVHPTGWLGRLAVKGSGWVALNPFYGTSGCSFHTGGPQNVNTAFVDFSGGAALGQVFDTASEISFQLKSAYSLAERKALPATNIRHVFQVYDNASSMYTFYTSTNSAGALQFAFGARGYSAAYTVPAGHEDIVFGKGVVVKIRIKWTATTFSLYINGVLAQTNQLLPVTPNWSSLSAFTIGTHSSRSGGYYSSDDSIAEFVIR